MKFKIPEIELDKKRKNNKEYYHNNVEKEALGVFLLARNEPTEVLAGIVPPREYKDSEVIEAMETELEKEEV